MRVLLALLGAASAFVGPAAPRQPTKLNVVDAALAAALADKAALTTLDLGGNNIGAEGAAALDSEIASWPCCVFIFLPASATAGKGEF